MKIKFNRDCTYPQNDPAKSLSFKSGEVYDLDAGFAWRWIRRGAAEEVKDEPPPPVAAVPEPEPEPSPAPEVEPAEVKEDVKPVDTKPRGRR